MKRIRLHLLTDGRDCTDGSSVKLMQQVLDKCKELSDKGCDARVASGGGRMKVTMDRYEVMEGFLEMVVVECCEHLKISCWIAVSLSISILAGHAHLKSLQHTAVHSPFLEERGGGLLLFSMSSVPPRD